MNRALAPVAASGLLIPTLAYWVSLAAGWLFAVFIEAPFWATAGLLALGALAALGVAKVLEEVTYEE